MHQTSLIATIVAALGLAFVLGVVANRLRLSPLVGYVAAGVLIGPFTPGYVADQAIAAQLAEIGVILLMFGVGLHFSLKDLIEVRMIAAPGAIGQMSIITLLGVLLAYAMGWSAGSGIVFGLALSVASTVVVLRALQERRLIASERGRIAVGWLVVQDLAMVMALVLFPALSGLLGGQAVEHEQGSVLTTWLVPKSLWQVLLITLVQLLAFAAVMLIVGRRLIPWLLHYVAHTGSRELFRLSVLAIALGAAFGSAELFGVSFALGAFFAGMILAESTLSQQAAQETLPLRDAFAVLFFVSVGMLFDPTILTHHIFPLAATFLIVIAGNAAVVVGIGLACRLSIETALTLGASLSQIGEFSFILAAIGVSAGVLPKVGHDLILAAAVLSILINPLMFMASDRVMLWFEQRKKETEPQLAAAQSPCRPELKPTLLSGHVVLVGYGRVGSPIGAALQKSGQSLLVIEEKQEVVDALRVQGIETICGNAAAPGILEAANLAGAQWFICAIPNPFENGNLIERARAANRKLEIIARAHSDSEVEYLAKLGADLTVMGEREIARRINEHILAQVELKRTPPTT